MLILSTTNPKTHIPVVGVRDAVAPDRNSTVGINAAHTAAAENAIIVQAAACPLPYIACHITHSVAILTKAAHWRSAIRML